MVFAISGCVFASMKSITKYENPSSNPIQRACSGFLIATCSLKVVPKAAYDPENWSKSPL
jgi:hypothetical protein